MLLRTLSLHYLTVMLVFAITGSLSVLVSRLLLEGVLGLEGSVWSGPWTYRIAYVALIPPSYSVILIGVGTLFVKREFFKRRLLATWGRILPLRRLRNSG